MDPRDPTVRPDAAGELDEPFPVVLPSRRHAQLLTQLLGAELDDYAGASGAGRHRDDAEVSQVASELGEVRDTLIDQLTCTD